MRNRKKLIVLATILFLAVGFASVSTFLIINGGVGIATNDADWDVKFIEADLTNEKGEAAGTAQIIDDGKKIVFTSEELNHKGAKTILDYTILNNSSQYDAEVTINCKWVDNLTDQNAVTVDSALLSKNNTLDTAVIEAKQTKSGKLTVELLKPPVDPTTVYIVCDAVVNATGRTSSGVVNAEEISITGITDAEGNTIPTVAQALDYLYENR